jgi:hypothetical protein
MRVVGTLCALLALSAPAHAQRQVQRLLASDMAQGDEFGTSVAIAGDWALIGAPLDDDFGLQSGSVYVFRRNGIGWTEVQKLTASDGQPSDSFGFSVAMEGTTAVIGAIHEAAQGTYDAGSAYVFELQGGVWIETAKIWATPTFSTAHFGWDVSISGNRILVGARDDPHGGLSGGAAYVFELSGPSWVQTIKLLPADPAMGSFFGQAVSLSGDVAVIGSSTGGPAGVNQGAAYVFEWNGAQWLQTIKLQASDGVASDFFGTSMAIGDERIVVGAAGHDHLGSNTGAAYAFERSGSTWIEVQEFFAPDADAQDIFGIPVALDGDIVLASAFADEDPLQSCGATYAFRREHSGWIALGKLMPHDSMEDKVFGTLAICGTTVLIGALGDDDACPSNPACNSGSAYVFELAPDARQYGHCAVAGPCTNPDTHGGCRNSTGQGANLVAGGSSSVALDELVLEASRLPSNASTMMFTGMAQANVPMGAGMRVVSGGAAGALKRFGVQPASSAGIRSLGPGIVAATAGFPTGPILAGQSWSFQCWYRDPTFACVRKTNLSNGVEVLFTP